MDRLTLVSPYIFVVTYLGYIGLGILFFSQVSNQFVIYSETFLFVGAGLGFYILGCQFMLPDKKKLYFLLTAGFVTFYGYQEYHFPGLIIPVVGLTLLRFLEKMKAEHLLIMGISFLTIELLMKGVPILNPELRKGYADPLFILGYASLFVGLAFLARSHVKCVFLLFLGSAALLSLFTYRVYIAELAIVVFVSLYILRKIQLIHVIMAAIPLFFLILLVGYIGVAYQEWELDAFDLFFLRPAFTFGVLNRIVHEAGYFGILHGKLWLKFTCGTVIGNSLFGYECNITSTILGPLIFDGGILELGLMAFFGAGTNTVYRKALIDSSKVPYYAILTAIFLVGIDVSFVPSIVMLFLAALYLVSEPET